MKERYQKLVNGLRNFCQENNFSQAVVAVSGGIDSALTLKIAVDSLGKKNVQSIFMPDSEATSEESKNCAHKITDFCQTKLITQSIDDFIGFSEDLAWKEKNQARANFKARIRMSLLYHFANSYKALVLGTCNKTEIMTGYFTKFGDGGADLEVIGDLFKTEVFAITRAVNIPSSIINRAPTAELLPDQKDEIDLGAKYEEIDPILRKIINQEAITTDLEKKILTFVENARHKNGKIPVLSAR